MFQNFAHMRRSRGGFVRVPQEFAGWFRYEKNPDFIDRWSLRKVLESGKPLQFAIHGQLISHEKY